MRARPSPPLGYGTADQIRAKVAGLAEAGVTHVCLYVASVETLETYGREIIPRFR